jgi:hypothetical protein
MQELLKQNILANVNAYINYTADIFRLASKYVWYSVLLYDKEYRDMQYWQNPFFYGSFVFFPTRNSISPASDIV